MKKRQRIPNNNPYYTNEPAVSRKQIADQSLNQNASLNTPVNKSIDKKPGRASGIAGFKDTHRPKVAKMAKTVPLPKPSRVPQQGRGGPKFKAHRIGQR